MELFDGEALTLADETGLSLRLPSDSELDERYVRGDVRIVTEQARYPLSAILGMIEGEDYELNPEFQRRHRWDVEKKSRLIESFIMNVPVPPIFLYEDRFSHYEVMDGLQRLTTIGEFYRDEFQLDGLTEWSDLNGRSYSKLPEQLRRGIDRRYLSSIILLQETAKSEDEARRLKQLVFERINSGGVRLEPQESRNAVYNGPLNELCIRLARNPNLCRTWDIPEPTLMEEDQGVVSPELLANEHFRRMQDVELVLRFFAYRQRLTHHRGALSTYLDTYLRIGNSFHRDVLEKLEKLFKETISLVADVFGEKAFWLQRQRKGEWAWYQRPTTVVYDPLMYAFSGVLDRQDAVRSRREAFRESIIGFYRENYASFEGRYTNIANVRERNALFEKFVEDNIGS